MKRVGLSLLVVLGVAGCGDVVRAPITVVVDTDRARHLEEQGRLQELRVGVQGDRAELEKARADLQEARRRLEDTAVDPAGRAAAVADIKALEARLGASSSSVSRADLDAALIASEQRITTAVIAELERMLAGRPASPSSSSPSSAAVPAAITPPPRTDVDARALVASARQQLAARGLVVADVPDGLARVDRVEGALRTGDAEGAAVVARELVAASTAVVVDRPLVRRKFERLTAATKKAGRTDLQAKLTSASKAISAEDFAGANALLNEVESALR